MIEQQNRDIFDKALGMLSDYYEKYYVKSRVHNADMLFNCKKGMLLVDLELLLIDETRIYFEVFGNISHAIESISPNESDESDAARELLRDKFETTMTIYSNPDEVPLQDLINLRDLSRKIKNNNISDDKTMFINGIKYMLDVHINHRKNNK